MLNYKIFCNNCLEVYADCHITNESKKIKIGDNCKLNEYISCKSCKGLLGYYILKAKKLKVNLYRNKITYVYNYNIDSILNHHENMFNIKQKLTAEYTLIYDNYKHQQSSLLNKLHNALKKLVIMNKRMFSLLKNNKALINYNIN